VHGAGRGKTLISRFGLLALVAFVSMSSARAANLKVEIVQQFKDYIREVEERLAPRFQGEQFLWSDQHGGPEGSVGGADRGRACEE
jgi:hypothetical protein